MKKLFFIAAMASVALVSCVKNEVLPVNDGQQEITYMTSPVTKANPTFSIDNKFVSYAYLLTDGNTWAANSSASTPYIEDKLIQHHAAVGTTSAKWAHATDTYYWPKDAKSSLTFFAWADGTSDPRTGKAVASCSRITGVKFENYDITDKGNINRDILVAKISADQKANSTNSGGSWDTGVPTVFQHILCKLDTKINLDAAYGDVIFTLKSIKLIDVDTKNTYTQGVDATNDPSVTGWGTPSEPEDLTIFDGSIDGSMVVEYNSKEANDITETGYTILMPQRFTESTEQIQIVYTITTNYAGTSVTEEVTYTKDLIEIYQNSWASGTAYTLTITLGLDEILWDPAVANWTEGTTDTWAIN